MEMRLTPLKAIRKHCLECSNGSAHEVKNCIITDCALFRFRLGKNPARQGIGPKSGVPRQIVNSVDDSEQKTEKL